MNIWSHESLFLSVCFEPHKQFLSYMVAVTIAGDRATGLQISTYA
jgi:hypothetical protein